MEDGLESSRVTLYEFDEKTAKKKELNSCSCLYVYKHNGEIIIIASKDKAIEYSIQNHCCIQILNETEKDIYTITNCVYSNGIFIDNK